MCQAINHEFCFSFPSPPTGVTFHIMKAYLILTLWAFWLQPLAGREFTLMVYNVENLFDVDGVAVFNDYQPATEDNPDGYTPAMFLTKLRAIADTLALAGEGRGPEIVLFQEIEADQTPERWHGDLPRFLADYQDDTVEELLLDRLTEDLRGVPAEVWLYKKLADRGMHEYFVDVAEYNFDPEGRPIAHVNVIFSKFPIIERRTHHFEGERGIQEVLVDVDGNPLYLFNNHWKAGAGNATLEEIRRGQARVLRQRLDEIFTDNPLADVIVAGDFNSLYNQSTIYPEMGETAVNDILEARGDLSDLGEPGGPLLYNLWFEVPPEERGSEVFRGLWGTLMQILIPRGLLEGGGIQYVDQSFEVLVEPGFNADPVTGVPLEWVQLDEGGGVSDHLPLVARFRVATDKDAEIQGRRVDHDPKSSTQRRPVDFASADASRAYDASGISELRRAANYGRTFVVEGEVVTTGRPFEVAVHDETYVIWSFDESLREALNAQFTEGDIIRFAGVLNQYRGVWQFVIHDGSWVAALEGAETVAPLE